MLRPLLQFLFRLVVRLFFALFYGLKSFIKHLLLSDNDLIGMQFERFARKTIFPASNYKLIHRTASNIDNAGDFVDSSLAPDFLFECLNTRKKFWVECKYRSSYTNDVIWSTPSQVDRYLSYDRDIPVYILLGVNGYAGSPDEVFLFSLRKFPYPQLFGSALTSLQIKKAPFKIK